MENLDRRAILQNCGRLLLIVSAQVCLPAAAFMSRKKTYSVTAKFAPGYGKEDFIRDRHRWENEQALINLNQEFQKRGLLLSASETFSTDQVQWHFAFASNAALDQWRRAVVSRQLLRTDKVSRHVRYNFQA